MQDYWNGNSSYVDWFYLHEECTDWKNLYRSGLGMSFVIFLPENSNDKAWGTGTGGSRINGFNRKEAAEGLCQTQKPEMSLYGRENILCEL